MRNVAPRGIMERLTGGLSSFSVSHFDRKDRFADNACREPHGFLSEYITARLFAAGSPGERFSLATC